jgi:hypothetical protein
MNNKKLKPVTKIGGMRKKINRSTNEKYTIMSTIRSMNMTELNASRLTLVKNDKTSVDIYYPSIKILKDMIIVHNNQYTTVKGNLLNEDIQLVTNKDDRDIDHDTRIQKILDKNDHLIMDEVNHIDFGTNQYRHLISNLKVFKFVKYGTYIIYGDISRVEIDTLLNDYEIINDASGN